jgi:hypothetical protein
MTGVLPGLARACEGSQRERLEKALSLFWGGGRRYLPAGSYGRTEALRHAGRELHVAVRLTSTPW